ncbi:chitin deacetylase [Lentinula aciculospora]|uniref:chitin deacetylase n=1 Tax=Lentinula aciculospora TaxID=153920 RepID=A0A9W9AB46_9AGAR|nr:chitin deacetylase [Lentinula aciculospora]
MLLSFLLPIAFSLSASAAPSLTSRSTVHQHRIIQRLPSNEWFHPRDHPVHRLFRRDADTDSISYPEVGSPTWAAAYPSSTPDSSQLPAAWSAALNAAVQAGKIPNIPQSSSLTPNTNPVYPDGYDPTGPDVCSGTYKCQIPGNIWDAPDGFIGTGFDDGPTPASPALLDFLEANNETVTHFMIGVNIIDQPDAFNRSVELGHDIAVHTWTHPYMTTLSNEDVLAQLGWTLQLIHNSTGGRLPKFWRPPYGDTDVRVNAIAKEVLGMETILWNQDTEDWSLTNTGGTTAQAINSSMTTWLTGSKTPGLIILEHELSDQSVQAFEAAYPVMKSNGWNLQSVAQLAAGGQSAYQNAISINTGSVTPADIIFGNVSATLSATASSTLSSSSSTSRTPSSENATPSKNVASSADNSSNSAFSTWSKISVGRSAFYGALISAGVIFL